MAGLTGVISGDLVKIVSGIAPVLGSVLGSPLAGVAVSLIASAFGKKPDEVGSILEKLLSNPADILKLKEIEITHAETLAQIAAQDYATEVNDRIDARKNANLYKDFLRHMAYLVTIGFFGVLVLMFVPLQLSETDKQLLSLLVGMLVSKWQTIIDFFYGSSRHKQDILNLTKEG